MITRYLRGVKKGYGLSHIKKILQRYSQFYISVEQTVGRKLPASSRVKFPGTIAAKYFA